jgi:hypothetical protein
MNLTKNEKILTVALIATILIASAVILSFAWRISNTGKIKAVGVGVYWDLACTKECRSIDWGMLGPGDLAGSNLYVKNTKNTNATLGIKAGNFTPAVAQQYLTLAWNYTGIVIRPEQVLRVQITLYVSQNVTGFTDFSFDITITATEH